MESALSSAGLKVDAIAVTQEEHENLRFRLYCQIARRDLASCRNEPSVVLVEYFPQYLENVGATLANIGTSEEELKVLRAHAHLCQARMTWSQLPNWEACRSHLTSILYHLKAHQQIVRPIELEEGQKYPYDFTLIGATREQFMKLWQQTAPPDPSEIPRTQEHQGTLFEESAPPPKKKFKFRRREKPAPTHDPRAIPLFPIKS